MHERIQKEVTEALAAVGAPQTPFLVERPSEMAHGDYATNAALAAAKLLKREPRELASELAGRIEHALGDSVIDVVVAGPGFINLTLSRERVTRALAEADARAREWGKSETKKGVRVSIEYSNPNPFKEMHIGHLMSNIIGESLSRLIEASGAGVVRDTFGGDVGPHVAKALWGLMSEKAGDVATAKELGDAYARGSKAYEEDDGAKQEIDALNVRIYDVVARAEGALLNPEDAALLALWKKGREVSMEEFRRLFALLGTKLDFEFFDSDTTAIGMRVVNDGIAKGVFEESEGAVIYRGEKKGLHTLVFITSRGTPTYETKDIGLAFLKEERIQSDKVLIVTAAEQIGHFKVVLAALEEIDAAVAHKTAHVPHGLLRLSSGKMSSRAGNVITAEELIRSVTLTASEKNADPLIAQQVALGAIKYMILRQAPGSDIVFDEEKSLSLEGDSGPYLQYALVRAKSVLAKASEAASAEGTAPAEPARLERLILHFPEIVTRASQERSPNLLTAYLTELASEWNSFYAQERIIGGDFETYTLFVVHAFVHTMANGLTLLGIPTPEKM